ncbi:MAG: hypothetical protein QM802_25600 [Agriterribacter sp.]
MKTRALLFVTCLFCTVTFLFISCGKEHSFEIPTSGGNDSTIAKYTLGAGSDTCTGAVLAGTYMNGVAMSAANTVTIQVTVTSKGAYNITTNIIDGVSFAAKGSFTNTGTQTVVLTATGTPASTGEKTFSVIGASNNCNFDITFSPAAPPAVFTLAGSPDTCTAPVIAGVYAKGTALSASNTVTLKVNVTTAGSYNITTNTANGISFSGSGVFLSAGNDIDVILTGSGTPSDKGITTLSPNITSSCSFNISIADELPVGDGIFTCKVDGTLITFNQSASADITDPMTEQPYLMLGGHKDGDPENYFHIFISNNDVSPVKAGTYDEKHFVGTSLSDLGYRIEADYIAKNADLSTTMWNTSSNIPGFSVNPAFTIVVTSITSTRVKGTFSGKLTNTPDNNKTVTITEGAFDLPIQ